MSLYSQNMYGQPSYAGPSFSSPPPVPTGYQQYYHQAPPPAPVAPTYPVDAISFRRDYASRLADLTFNSRPIIQHLSMLAQDYSRFADIVAQCIEGHIRRVPPWMKLPAFYLLDAVSKNVYEPYAQRFSSFVVPLYIEMYSQVDESTRGKMEEMLLTWRTGSPAGKELFGLPQQIAIERSVWGDGGTTQSSITGFHSGSGQITKSQVISELQFTLGQKERALQSNPYDTASQNHIAVLHQLRKLVEAGVSQDELRQILAQLRNLVKSTAPIPVPQPIIPAPTPSWQSQPPFPPQQLPQAVPLLQSYSQSDNVPMEFNVKPEATTGLSAPPNPPANIANLLSTLLKAGVLSASGTPVGAGATAKEEAALAGVAESSEEASRSYRNAILSVDINLNSVDLAKTRPMIVEFLYNRLDLQCKQCGIRFPDTILGKKNLEGHLDMHFRQNRKANQNMGRGHSRSWFIGIEDWIQDISGDGKGKGRADGSGPLNAKAAAAAENAKREAELRAQYVIVPAGDEAQVVSCPICKETLKSEFLEDDEEWAWKNAVKKDDRIYHATCHAERAVLTSTFAARLRNEKDRGSRSATPEVQPMSGIVSGSRATPPPSVLRVSGSKSPSHSPSPLSKVGGTKRKVEHSDVNAVEEASDTPPLKKIALSPILVSDS
ncbi:hypothetical protein B0H34DRAFT_688435 [Crassisporium funariophilum]|nr:hypothetical protein B0H34DRAFT_688435 [Crassisporium funariophilum]